MRRLPLLTALLLACPICWADQAPEDFAYGVPVEIDPAQPLQQLEIPPSVYEGATRGDLGDLRVFNASGEPVPYAFVPRAAPGGVAAQPRPLNLFPLHAARGARAGTLQIRAQRSADGAIVSVASADTPGGARHVLTGYLVDASSLRQPLAAIELRWRDSGDVSGSLQVEGSDDFTHWAKLAEAAPLVSLEFAGQRIERRTVELRAARYKYLRLTWPPDQIPLTLTALMAQPSAQQIEPERRWKSAAGTAGQQPGEYLFDLGGWLPVDRLRVELPQPNTLVSLQLLARNGADQPWQPIAGCVQYRLRRDGQDIVSPDLQVSALGWRYWLLRVDQKGGGLGAGEPRLHAGWVPQELVFVARGTAPFQLAYGRAGAQPVAYPIATIVPGWHSDSALHAVPARTGAQRELAGAAALRPPPDVKTWLLWGSLALAVAALAWMAWRLARDLNRGA